MKPLANTVALGSATNVYKATAVYVANDGTARTLTVANTATDTGNGQNGNYAGGSVTIRIAANAGVVIRKRPNDTILGAGTVYGTKVAENGA
ncbi:MAG: hypothetical protein H8D23_06655 [Candidatus Brocadiales bacterium]|nr:hypothetical protein [Candidatus Brocadiales bacterium]